MKNNGSRPGSLHQIKNIYIIITIFIAEVQTSSGNRVAAININLY